MFNGLVSGREYNFLRRSKLLTKEKVKWTLEGLAGRVKEKSARLTGKDINYMGQRIDVGKPFRATVGVAQVRDDGAWTRKVIVEGRE